MTSVPEPGAARAAPAVASPADINSDLGFGSVVARDSRRRLLNRDGTFNVRRGGLPLLQSLSPYHYFLTVTWPRFFMFVVAAYLLTNTLFAGIFLACGADALTGFAHQTTAERFGTAFFFSVQTLATIGYGGVAPHTLAANIVVTVESLIGLLGLGLVAGIMFSRFSRPMAQIVFSDRAIVAPYRGITALMFRIVNQRANEMVHMRATVLLARRKGADGQRDFTRLELERDRVVLFPLTWTIVHPIDESSPLHGVTAAELLASDAELLILLDGFDETFSQTVHARSSYRADEVVWGARFRSVFDPLRPDGMISVDIRKLHEFEASDENGR